MKIGRNDLCICGSGKKYKKCCIVKESLDEDIPSAIESYPNENLEDFLYEDEYDYLDDNFIPYGSIATTTKESYMLIRLCYRIHDIDLLKASLHKLKCIEFISENQIILSYHKDAKNFGLSVTPREVPCEVYPVLLAKCFIEGEYIYCDVKSVKRAIRLDYFLFKHLTEKLISLDHFMIENLTFSAAKENLEYLKCNDFSEIFSNNTLIETRALLSSYYNDEYGGVEKLVENSLPKFEKVILDEGGNHNHVLLVFNLILRHAVAIKSFEDGVTATPKDILPYLVEKIGDFLGASDDEEDE